jgi:hypothetical protein
VADRIEVDIASATRALVDDLDEGSVDVTLGQVPTDLLPGGGAAPSLADRVVQTNGSATSFIAMNLAQPPFDDVHVRRALAYALARRVIARSSFDPGSATSHLVPDPMEESFLTSWNPFPSADPAGDPAAARREMDASRYGLRGRCAGPVCTGVLLQIYHGDDRTGSIVRKALSVIGIRATVVGDVDCGNPRAHIALCVAGWAVDYPDTGNFFVALLSARLGNVWRPTLLGSTREELRSWGYDVRLVPSIDDDYTRCAAQLGIRATMCWARMDQLVVGRLVAIIPLATDRVLRLKGARVSSYSMDQAFGGEPSLDRIRVGA